MLINCPECELQVSDKAITCPHCGYPFKEKAIRVTRTKRKRLPNGFGQISEIKGRNLRKPFRAMVSIGKYPNGRPICKPLRPESYFKTYNEAYEALIAFNKSPYTLAGDTTMKELYERWSKYYFPTIGKDSADNYGYSWKHCESLKDIRVVDLKISHIKYCMKETEAGERRQKLIKMLFSKLLDYAVEYEIVDKNIAKSFSLDKEITKVVNSVQKGHTIFPPGEILKLKNNLSVKGVDMILIQCYSGWRPRELCSLKIENINLEDGFFTGGMKTDAGKNRIVPIHSQIIDLVKGRIEQAKRIGSEYLFGYESKGRIHTMEYMQYNTIFTNVMKELGLNIQHTPHDCRKHFITIAKACDVDEYAIKYMVGHAIRDITEDIYTERDPNWLKSEIEKITV